MGAIQSSCYTCWVRHGLTLAISPKPQKKFRLVINQSVGSCRVKLIPEVWSCPSTVCLKVISFIVSMLYILCVVFWYYPLFVAICEIWLLILTYGAYLVLSLNSGITARWWWWKGKGRPRWRWWKRKGLVRCAVVVVEGAVRWWRWLEVGDDPDRSGPPSRETERREREWWPAGPVGLGVFLH